MECFIVGVRCRILVDTGTSPTWTITQHGAVELPRQDGYKHEESIPTSGVRNTVTVTKVPVEQDVWLADIVEPCILGLDALGPFGATMDTVANQLHASTQAKTVHGSNSLDMVSHEA